MCHISMIVDYSYSEFCHFSNYVLKMIEKMRRHKFVKNLKRNIFQQLPVSKTFLMFSFMLVLSDNSSFVYYLWR